MDMAALGQRLTSLRLALGKSQQEIANAAIVARSYYAQMERGTILSVSLDRIERLGLALGVTRAYLLGDATQATRAFPASAAAASHVRLSTVAEQRPSTRRLTSWKGANSSARPPRCTVRARPAPRSRTAPASGSNNSKRTGACQRLSA